MKIALDDYCMKKIAWMVTVLMIAGSVAATRPARADDTSFGCGLGGLIGLGTGASGVVDLAKHGGISRSGLREAIFIAIASGVGCGVGSYGMSLLIGGSETSKNPALSERRKKNSGSGTAQSGSPADHDLKSAAATLQ